ncbi:variant erythrocyte surface antigen-1 family protein [Babesia caballi]|uniref:Variant erythrocyte surface antigen-1 family protein n=1 Tax=Babesia caballi TaxID=5871 RepID=A0AAV4LPG0_BABCB|nr:variant erythrocyte surface antigen-1 family protein [Babesia caballi]
MSGSGQKKSLTEPPENLKEAIDWVLRSDIKDTSSSVNVLITAVADALKKFIGYTTSGASGNNYTIKIGDNGIIKPGEIYSRSKGSPRSQNKIYTSAYYGAAWFTDVNSGGQENQNIKKKKAVQCFFTAIEIIFEGLTELYWKCKKDWSSTSLGGSGDDGLKKLMQKNGFSGTHLNTSITGQLIADTCAPRPHRVLYSLHRRRPKYFPRCLPLSA